MVSRIKALAAEGFTTYQAIRRHIHSHPELSFQETETAAFVSKTLIRLGIQHITGIGGTGILATIDTGRRGRLVALRSELDALPITELNDVPYKSVKSGIMHACGHDVHTACLLGAASVLQQLFAEDDSITGKVLLIFQPGEEKHPGGASLLLQDERFTSLPIDALYALHVYPHLPSGMVGFRPGQYMASADEVYITIKGKGGHAALPHTTIDPVIIAAEVLLALQQVVSRKAPPTVPSVLSFGKIAGGHAGNVIPDEVILEGTFRTMNEAWRAQAHVHIRQVAEGICAAHNATALVSMPMGYPSLLNDEKLTARAIALAEEFAGKENTRMLDLRMTADDFAYYSQKMPACFFRLGTSKAGIDFTASVHNAHFDIDERALETGVGMLAWLAVNALRS